MARDELIGSTEAAGILGVTRANVWKMVNVTKVLEPVPAGTRTLLFRRADVERLAREGWAGRRRPVQDSDEGYPGLADDPGLNEDAGREAWETPGMGS